MAVDESAPGKRWVVRRFARMLAGAVVLALLPVTVSGCSITCACVSTPDPNWTPRPITAQEAAIYGAKMAGRTAGTVDDPSMTAFPINGPKGRVFYEATSANAVALIDAASGSVVEVILQDRMPKDAAVSAAWSDARSAAEAAMERTGTDITGLTDSVQLVQQVGVAAYEVWWHPAGKTATTFVAWVNASTGSVFAFLDSGAEPYLSAPLIGRDRAAQLAIAAISIPGETVTSIDLTIDIATGSQTSAWEVAFGVPTATQPDFLEHVVRVSVDAVTGATTIVNVGPTPYDVGPTPSPVRISQSAAGEVGHGFTGLDMEVVDSFEIGEPMYLLSAASQHPAGSTPTPSSYPERTYAFVSSRSGRVVEVVIQNKLPNGPGSLTKPNEAQATAQAFLQQAHVSTSGLASSVTLDHRASSDFYEVVWTEDGVRRHEVLVDSWTGAAFAYLDLVFAPTNLGIPVVGSVGASRLIQGDFLMLRYPVFEVRHGVRGEPQFSWLIGLARGDIRIDAVTGEETTAKEP